MTIPYILEKYVPLSTNSGTTVISRAQGYEHALKQASSKYSPPAATISYSFPIFLGAITCDLQHNLESYFTVYLKSN
jgi:hypothetical protein